MQEEKVPATEAGRQAFDSGCVESTVEDRQQFQPKYHAKGASTLSDKIGKSLLRLLKRFYVGWNVRPSTFFDADGPIDPVMMPIDLANEKKFGRA